MNQKPISPITLARKKREAAALKANMKRRKEQAKAKQTVPSEKKEPLF
jgi:uncharacterized membrane protein YqiK